MAAPARIRSELDEFERTIGLLEEASIGVFPSVVGKKGTYVEGWPDMPLAEAIALVRNELRAGKINLAGRSGNGYAVLDLDAKTGSPDDTLRLLRDLLGEAIFAIVKTSRGYHVWVRILEAVGNGYCAAIGGEVFSGPHLAMLPPSKHPDGVEYAWVLEPRPTTSVADLRAFGLVPASVASGTGGGGRARTAAPPDTQDEFAALMQRAGVQRTGTRDQTLAQCPWHADRSPSLSINWTAAIFHCFSTSCDKQGGLVALRQLVGVDTPSYRQCTQQKRQGKTTDDKLGCPDADAESERLASGLEELGEYERAQKVRECRRFFRVGKCTNCARTPAYPLSCGDPLCVRCMPGRLAADWQRHEDALPTRLTLLRLRPRESVEMRDALKKIRARFRDWRARSNVAAGMYGVRLDSSSGAVILLGIPADEAVPESTRAFDVEVVALDEPANAFVRWLQDEYIDEAVTWHDALELGEIILETRGRRRFQGFGAAYARSAEQHETESDETAPKKPLGRISGGALKGKRATGTVACAFCGGKVEWYTFSVPADQVEKMGDHWLWMGAPRAAAA